MDSSVIGFILLMCSGFILQWLEQPRIVNLAVDMHDLHRIHVSRIQPELSCTSIGINFLLWPPIASMCRLEVDPSYPQAAT